MKISCFRRTLTLFVFIYLAASAYVPAATWYVDPVNGSDNYDGSSPFHVPNSNIGPTQTVEGVLYMTNQFDILVLMDGIYAGRQNTSRDIFFDLHDQRLYVTSANGPENCTFELQEGIYLDRPAISPDELSTQFSGITFSAPLPYHEYAMIYIQNNSSVRFDECVFSGFQANPNNAIITIADAAPVFDGCRFIENPINLIIRCTGNAAPVIVNCDFTNNVYTGYSSDSVSMITAAMNTMLTVKNCQFSDNRSTAPFYAINIMDEVQFNIDDCVIENNTNTGDFGYPCVGIFCSMIPSGIITDTRFENLRVVNDNNENGGTGIHATGFENLIVSNCQFHNNKVGMHLYMTEGSNDLKVYDCEFTDNTGSNDYNQQERAGGIFIMAFHPYADIEIRQCTFRKNHAAILTWPPFDFTSFAVENCLIADNAYCGIAVNNYYSPEEPERNLLIVNNCTFANNGQFALSSHNVVVENSILRHESTDPIPTSLVNIENIICNYCNIQGGWTGDGTGNIDVDPLFADPGVWNPDPALRIPGTDYHLKSTAGRWDSQEETLYWDQEDSPCIDAGDPAVVSYFEPIGSGGRINMGAYGNTWQASRTDFCISNTVYNSGLLYGDINKDCRVNLADFAIMADDWLQTTVDDTIFFP